MEIDGYFFVKFSLDRHIQIVLRHTFPMQVWYPLSMYSYIECLAYSTFYLIDCLISEYLLLDWLFD